MILAAHANHSSSTALRRRRRIVQAAAGRELSRHFRHRLQFQGPHLRHPSRADAADGVRRRRQFHPRLRRRHVRTLARPADRRRGQYLGHGCALQHGLQVRSFGAARDGARRQGPRRRVASVRTSAAVRGAERSRGRAERRHLRAARPWQGRLARHQIRPRRRLHQDLGRQGQGAGPVRPAALAGVRRAGAALHRRPQQRPHPGVRRRRQLYPRSPPIPARPAACSWAPTSRSGWRTATPVTS